MATTRSSVNFSKFPKGTHQLLCRSCGDPGWYEDIADDPNDDEYGICRDCEVTIQAREESDICEDCMATIGGKVEGCDTCNITRFYKGRWYEPYED